LLATTTFPFCNDALRLRGKAVRLRIDLESDALYIRFSENPIAESEEVKEGVILDFDADGHLVGLEVLNFTQHFGWRDLRTIQIEVPVAEK